MNERNSLLYQIEALQQEVLFFQRKTEMTVGQLQLWKKVAHHRHLRLDQQMKTIASLTTKFQSAESYHIAAGEQLDEQKEWPQSLL